MSSVITIGFFDRTRACIRAEFIPPLADDERRELLIHGAMLAGRAFAALPPESQQTLAGALREWIAQQFALCPIQLVTGDPMACPHRFAATFLAPVREYALATTGGSRASGDIEYFLPMAAAAFLRHVATSVPDPEELLKPALSLCAAVAIHPVTVDNHFQMATASLPKVEPVVDRTASVDPLGAAALSRVESRRHLRETRRSLVVAACVAALVIMAGVQYLSTREPDAGVKTLPPLPSPEAHTYFRQARDLAEDSLAQVEAMLAAVDRNERRTDEVADTLDRGIQRLQSWQRQFMALTPPPAFQGRHQEIRQLLSDLERMALTIRPSPAGDPTHPLRARLITVRDRLERVLSEAGEI